MFFGPEKILVVLVLALILLGPDKLPAMGRQLGAAWKAFRQFQAKVETEVRNTVPDLPSTADLARYARSPVALLNSLADLEHEDPVPDPAAAGRPLDGDAWPPDPAAPEGDGADPGTPAAGTPTSDNRAPGTMAPGTTTPRPAPAVFSLPDDPGMN